MVNKDIESKCVTLSFLFERNIPPSIPYLEYAFASVISRPVQQSFWKKYSISLAESNPLARQSHFGKKRLSAAGLLSELTTPFHYLLSLIFQLFPGFDLVHYRMVFVCCYFLIFNNAFVSGTDT